MTLKEKKKKTTKPKLSNKNKALVKPTKAPIKHDITSKYLMDISKYPLLTREEELELAKRLYHNDDDDAAKKLATSNLRFVVKIASEYNKFGLKLIDLIQEGNMGLLVAIKKFNPYRDIRLTSYAVWWIRSYIHDYLLKQWSLVKIGTTASQKKLFYRLKQEQEKLKYYLDSQGVPKLLEHKIIAANLGVKEKEVAEMEKRLQGGDLSLDAHIGDDENAGRFVDTLADKNPNPEELLTEKDLGAMFNENLDEFLETLNPRDTFILQNRLLTDEPTSLQEIGNKYKISRERVRQLEEKIKKNLKNFILDKQPNFEG